jgi:ubiquinone/menaquinone biosynthesis C-methylase UbiE
LVKATGWERIYQEKGDVQGYFRVLPKIRKVVPKFRKLGYRRILDLACGTGRHALYLAKRGFEVYATDMAGTALKITQEKAASLGLNNIYFREHDMRNIPFVDEYFDAVICTLAIHHGTALQVRQTVKEIHRVLKKGGMVITDMPSVTTEGVGHGKEMEKNTYLFVHGHMEDDVPHHYVTREEVKSLFQDFPQLFIRLMTYNYTGKNDGKKHFSKRYYISAIK